MKWLWRDVVALAGAPWELYDIDADRAEGHDLAAAQPEVTRELSGEYDRWAERCGVAPWDQIAAKRPAR